MATGIAIAAAIVAAAGAAVLGITHRRKRVERAELVRSWAVAFAAAVGADSRNHGALPAIDDQLRKAGPGDEDLAIFLERGLDERIDEARAARALVLELGTARIRDAATDVGKLPEPLREALFEEILRDVDELPAAPPARPDISTVEVAVRYLELIQDGAVRAYNAAGRLFVLRVILTVLLLAVAAGIAKVDPKDLPWFGLELDPAEVLVGSSVFVSVLQFLDVLHYERGHQLSVRAVRLYAELGFPAPRAEWKSPENPLRLQYAAAVTNEPLLSKHLSYDFASLGGQVLALLFLLGTQVVVFFTLKAQSKDDTLVYLFLILPLATLAFSVVRYKHIYYAHKAVNEALRREQAGLPPRRSASGAVG